MYGVTFDEKHTYNDFGLCCTSVEIGAPNVKKKVVNLKGADGMLDLSEVFGRVLYGNRKLKFTFDHEERNYTAWATHLSALFNYLHGKRRQITLDNDPNYYYDGRVAVKGTKNNKPFSLVTIEIDAAPYKRELHDAMTYCWNWDKFSFLDGVIREYYDIRVDGSYTLVIFGSEMPIMPVIYSSTAMTATYNGVEYELHAGENKPYGLIISEGRSELVFTGTGTVSISYRGGKI